MNQLDALIERFAAGRISRRGLVKGAAALGVSGAGAAGAAATAASCSRSRPRTRSSGSRRAARSKSSTTTPTGSRSQDRLLRRHRDRRSTGDHRGDRRHQGGRRRPGRHGLPSPGVFSLDVEPGSRPRLRLPDGRLRRLRLRLPKGTGDRRASRTSKARPSSSATPAGRASSIRWSPRPAAIRPWSSTSPPARSWGQALQQGQADAALAWAGLRAQWRARVSTSTTSWARTGRSSRPTRSSDPPLRLRGRGARRHLQPLPARLGDGAGVRPPQPARRDPDHR